MNTEELKEIIKSSKNGVASTNKVGLNPTYYHCFVLDTDDNIHVFKTDEFVGGYVAYAGILGKAQSEGVRDAINAVVVMTIGNIGVNDFDNDFIEDKKEFLEYIIKQYLWWMLDEEVYPSEEDIDNFIKSKKLILR